MYMTSEQISATNETYLVLYEHRERNEAAPRSGWGAGRSQTPRTVGLHIILRHVTAHTGRWSGYGTEPEHRVSGPRRPGRPVIVFERNASGFRKNTRRQ